MNRTLTPLVTKRLTQISTTQTAEPFTEWFPAVGLQTVKAMLLARAATEIGAMEGEFAMQTAAVSPDQPDAWVSIDGTPSRTVPFAVNTGEIALSIGAKMWVRFGMLYAKGAAGTYTQAELSVQTSFVSRGMVVGQMPAMTVVSVSNTVWQTIWSTPWVPAEWIDKVGAGLWLGALSGSPSVRLAYQTATVRASDPSAWTALMPAGVTAWTTAGDKTSGLLPASGTPFASVMWVRFGVQVLGAIGATVTVGGTIGIRRT